MRNFDVRPRGTIVIAVLLLIPAIAHAELPANGTVRVGLRPAEVAVRVAASERGAVLEVGSGARATRVEVSIRGASDVSFESVAVAGGASIGIVRVRGEGSAVAAAIIALERGRPAVVWQDRLDPVGDPGERHTGVLETSDRTNDGVADVLVAHTQQNVAMCGGAAVLLSPRAIDPRTLELRAVTVSRLPSGGREVPVGAVLESPGPPGPPIVRALRFGGVTSRLGATDSSASAPELADGNAATYWAEGRAGIGTYELATARSSIDLGPIRALALVLPEADASQPSLSRPKTLWLVGDDGTRLAVTVPDTHAIAGPTRVWVVPPSPLAWSCVTVVLGEAWVPNGVSPDDARVALAEVEAYTELDFGGADAIVDRLDAPDDHGAVEVLLAMGERGLDALLAEYGSLTNMGKGRAVRVLAANLTIERARTALIAACSDPSEEARVQAFEALRGAGVAGVPALIELARGETPFSDEAAMLVARTSPSDALAPLLAALAGPGGAARPGLRRATAVAIAGSGETGIAAIAPWGEQASVAARASLALGLSRRDAAEGGDALGAAALELATRAAHDAHEFDDRYRIGLASAGLGASDELDAWLASAARGATEWMMRALAIVALGERGRPVAIEIAQAALGDEYPRVRAEAVAVLAAEHPSEAATALRDPFPLVRARAIEALAPSSSPVGPLRQAVGDAAMSVRVAAIEALRARRDRASWNRIAHRLTDDGEWPEVVAAGIRFAKELCVPEATSALGVVLRRGSDPRAWAPDVESAALALDALASLGTDDARILLRRTAEGGSDSLRMAAQRALASSRPCRPSN